jgi:murein DD-endopeptidase MepM/ murein hydrolase activator NlpD
VVRQPPSTRRRRRSASVVLLVGLLAVGLSAPSPGSASPGSPDGSHARDREHRLDSRIDSQSTDVDDVSAQLLQAQGRLDAAVGDLAAARSRLADLRGQVRVAIRVDRRMQTRLEQAVVRLRDARADVRRGQGDVEAKRSALVGYAVSSYQNGGLDAYGLGMALDSGGPQQAVDGMQDVATMLNKQTVDLQELQAMKVLLTLTEQRVEATKDDVAQQRRAAADNLALKRSLESQATVAERQVRSRVLDLRTQRQQLAAAKAVEVRRLNELQAERHRVELRLQRVAEQRAREHNTTISTPPTTTVTENDGGYLSYPVKDTYITSPYGMRMHPILHIWKLHDGTDFHADCGTPVYAAAGGTVTEEYYNSGYGNRVIMDNGYVNGVSLATSYNHLTSFVAGVGQHVARGQLIAYSGTTGYSTGCHLHFMVYVNGATVDPMTWL